VPVGIVAATLNGEGYDNALATGIADIFVGDIENSLPMARLKPVLRLAGQRRQLFCRRILAEAASGNSLAPPDLAIDDDPCALLFIGKSDAARARITQALGDAGGIVGSADLFAAGQWLSEAPFDACILCMGPGDDPYNRGRRSNEVGVYCRLCISTQYSIRSALGASSANVAFRLLSANALT